MKNEKMYSFFYKLIRVRESKAQVKKTLDNE